MRAVTSSGTVFDGRYRIVGLLGQGGMGHVYAAEHVALGQRVAIKVLHPELAADERFRARFLQEARAASMIRHPNVVEIKDFGRAPNGPVYFVMEQLQGHDLGVELRREGMLPWARARNILLQAASALQAAHERRIIHRDIKPGNCFLIGDRAAGVVDVVKLVDFGIAKVGDPSIKGLTGAGEIIGTVSYMSPEQARSQPLDARSDVYSLGAMAYEMLTGLVPFRGGDAFRVITAHLEEQPEPVRRLAPEVPAAADALVLRMLAKAPQDRYPSMAAVVEALRAIPEKAGTRSTKLWSPAAHPGARAARRGVTEIAPASVGSAVEGPPVADAEAPVDGERTTVLHPVGSASAGRTAITETQRATQDTLATRSPAWEFMRPSRRFAGVALLGLLVLLAGGGTLLVAKAWGSNDAAHERRGSTVPPRDARAMGQPAVAAERGSSR